MNSPAEQAFYIAIGDLLSVSTRSNVVKSLVEPVPIEDPALRWQCDTLYSPRSVYHCINGGGPMEDLASYRQIYVVGDSHSLSVGHQFSTDCEMPASRRLRFIPKLVTGVKHHHLWGEPVDYRYTHGKDLSTMSELSHHISSPRRPANTKFYTKASFYHHINSIPSGSEVLFILGEIDCREGVLRALERDRYSRLADAMHSVISEFVRVLKDIIASKNIKVL